MGFWEKVKNDLQKGLKEGTAAIKEGAAVVRHKTEALSEEGKNKLKIFELKSKVKKEIAELGGHIYDLKSKTKNPFLDAKVKAMINRIKKLEDRIIELEGRAEQVLKKTISRKPTPKSR